MRGVVTALLLLPALARPGQFPEMMDQQARNRPGRRPQEHGPPQRMGPQDLELFDGPPDRTLERPPLERMMPFRNRGEMMAQQGQGQRRPGQDGTGLKPPRHPGQEGSGVKPAQGEVPEGNVKPQVPESSDETKAALNKFFKAVNTMTQGNRALQMMRGGSEPRDGDRHDGDRHDRDHHDHDHHEGDQHDMGLFDDDMFEDPEPAAPAEETAAGGLSLLRELFRFGQAMDLSEDQEQQMLPPPPMMNEPPMQQQPASIVESITVFFQLEGEDAEDAEFENQWTELDWRSSMINTQALCASDFVSKCQDQVEGFLLDEPVIEEMRPRRKLKHGHGPGHRHSHDKHHEHHGHGHGRDGRKRGCGGPLGFGSREADMCLREQRDDLSSECQAAMATTEGIFRALNQQRAGDEAAAVPPRHPATGFGLFVLFLLLGCLCLCRRRRLARMHHVLEALEHDPELRAAVEDAAGTPVPVAGWRCKIHAALQANPELKQAVIDAAHANREARPAPPRPGCCRLIKLFLISFFVFMTLSLLFCRGSGDEDLNDGSAQPREPQQSAGDEVAVQDESDPFVGFLFSVATGLALILCAAALCRCVKGCCKACSRGQRSGYPGEAAPEQELQVVYTGLPVEAPVAGTAPTHVMPEVPPLEQI